MSENQNPKTAVILVGGKSTRMGTDKFLLEINGMPQWAFMLNQLEIFFDQVYIACRPDQTHHFPNCNLVVDQIADIGPMGAIYSAFQQIAHGEHLFCVSCDLPHFKVEIAEKLYAHLNETTDVCAAQSPEKKYPEPLVAIWSRRVLPLLFAKVNQGDYALFKLMKSLNVQTANISDDLLKNVNRLEDL